MRIFTGVSRALLVGLALLVCAPSEAVVVDAVCARVKIEIKQELTLERQGFDAEMKINNTSFYFYYFFFSTRAGL